MYKHACTRHGVIASAITALVATPLALGLTQAPAQAASATVVINEVYVNGGSAGAAYTNKYVELRNLTGSAINFATTPMSVQYRAPGSSGSSSSKVALAGTIAANGYYTLSGGSNGTATNPVPGVDQTSSLNPGGAGGTITLVNGGTAVDPSTSTSVVDKLGYGTSNSIEGGAAAPTGNSVAKSLGRGGPSTDSDVNGTDFSAQTPTPDAVNGGNTPPVGACTGTKTIAEIQGDDTDTSPCVNSTVTTTGVVTAAYPTGGIAGFYIQTGGSPVTPKASDALLVYAGNKLTAGQYPAVGSTVRVTGAVSEYFGLTELALAGSTGVVAAANPQPAPTPQTVIPGTDCALPGTACLEGAALDAARERHEGEFFAPTGDYTVSDPYDGSPFPSTSSNNFGEIGLAAESDLPLIAPTELYDAQSAADISARTAYNDAHRVILDDASSTNYTSTTDQPFPWLTAEHTVREGAPVGFPEPVVLTYGNDTWKLEPSGGQVVGAPTGKVSFGQTRTAAPEAVGGDVRLATFNVLNYFPTTGEEFVGLGGGHTCTYYNDRAGNPVTNNRCNPDGPRGAANDANLQRQQDKIVHAIDKLGASIVSLEEIENSVKFGKNRDFALSTLVQALNDDAGAGTWSFAPSPDAANLPDLADQDVIRNAFIYKSADVSLVGASTVLTGSAAFDDAREPLAQGFKNAGASDDDAFAVIVNHLKSKGSGADDGTGQGNANPDRVAQAGALVDFADDVSTDLGGAGALFLTGDFNAYSMEDPVQVITGAGYANLDSTTDPDEESYNFGGLAGSLDHVFANPAAQAMVTGVDVWNINADEPVYYEYSRFNYNVTDLYAAGPFRASDHNPEVVGLDLPTADGGGDGGGVSTREIQVLATNDFHGRLENNSRGTEAGAAVLAGAVKKLRAADPDTVFAAAGDIIGASTFTSFIQNDKPTIDALNEAGLEVSAVGNHELDKGYDDLINRVMAPESAVNPEGGAAWQYISANLKIKSTGDPAVPATWVKSFGPVDVGFVGATTEELPSLVSPAGIADLKVDGIVTSVNTASDDLEDAGADVIVLLVHEGAPDTTFASATDPTNAFGKIVNGVDENVDAIVSGHTHLAYNHSVPVPAWKSEGRDVTERPVVSAGQYGSNLNKLVFTVDSATGEVTAKSQDLLPLKDGQSANYPADPATEKIVADAVAAAEPLGAVPLGQLAAPFSRAKFADGTTENRGGESTLGNLVAEIQQWATEEPEAGAAQIALMNPGGLRTDITGSSGDFPRTVTYRQAADVQPFANTLVNEKLTGAQIEAVLEQQWQTTSTGSVPSRPFLKLGVSDGFEYTYTTSEVPLESGPGTRTQGEITGMTLDGEPIEMARSYSVTVNSFLAAGGDNFRELANGVDPADTGKADLQAMVDYFDEFANVDDGDDPLPVDFSQRAVGATFADGESTFAGGDTATIDLSSLIMTGSIGTAPDQVADTKDDTVTVSLDGEQELDEVTVDQTIPSPGAGSGEADAASTDESGTSTASVVIPADTAAGAHELVVTGATTGTEVAIPITVGSDAPSTATVTAVVKGARNEVYKGRGRVKVSVAADGATPTGKVNIFDGAVRVGTGTLRKGTVAIRLDAFDRVGTHRVRVRYVGDDATSPAQTRATVVIVKQAPRLRVYAPRKVSHTDRPRVKVTFSVVGLRARGRIVITYHGTRYTRRASDSPIRIRLRREPRGVYRLKAFYRGDRDLKNRSVAVRIKVTR